MPPWYARIRSRLVEVATCGCLALGQLLDLEGMEAPQSEETDYSCTSS